MNKSIDEDDDYQGDSEAVDVSCPVSHNEAASMLERCLVWLECQEEANIASVTLLRELRGLVSRKRFSTLKQTQIDSFFAPV